jgi:hypothetical protein
MKTTPQIDSTLLTDARPISQAVTDRTGVTDFEYQQGRGVKLQKTAATTAKKILPELTTFRALSRQVFGARAGREYLAEAILFGSMMLVAAWPLSVTLNQLGTMMISPPNALW